MKRTLLLLTLMSIVVVFVAAAQETTPEPRTQYDSFDLSTPEAAVTTFIDLFQRGDYAGVFLIFAPETQHNWRLVPVTTFDYSFWVQSEYAEEIVTEVSHLFREGNSEHDVSIAEQYFHEIMVRAEERDAFLIDLSGDFTIISTSESVTLTGHPSVDVVVEGDTIESLVTFRMVQAPSGRWRVFQVIEPNGNEEWYPWAVGDESEE